MQLILLSGDHVMTNKYYFLAVIALTVTSCSAPKYSGPGTFEDFASARYQCVKESPLVETTRVGSSMYGRTGSSTTLPSCSVFIACLASKGYYKNSSGQFDAAAAPVACN